jgi:signal peptidase I
MHMGDPGGGFIDKNEVVGKAWLRVWPISRFGFMHHPDIFNAVQDR